MAFKPTPEQLRATKMFLKVFRFTTCRLQLKLAHCVANASKSSNDVFFSKFSMS